MNNKAEVLKRPKRRKDRYNPYIITESLEGHYYVEFQDEENITYCEEITKEIFNEFNAFELQDLSYLNKVDRHLEHFDLSEESINNRAVKVEELVEDIVIQQMDVKRLTEGIEQLPQIQRRRLLMYYFYDLTYSQIAEKEACSHTAVIYSIKTALKNLKNYFEK